MTQSVALRVPRARPLRLRGWRWAVEGYFFIVPTALLLVTLLIYPLFYSVQTSLSTFSTTTFQPTGFVGLKNYERILHDANFWSSLKVTALYLLVALPLQMVVGVAIAFILSIDWTGNKLVRALFIIPMVVTPVVGGSVWKMMLDPLWGYLNYLWSLVGGTPIAWLSDPKLALFSIILIDTWRSAPFVILIVLAGIVSLDQEPLESAWVDGASRWQRLIYVEIPMLQEVILSAFIVRWLTAIKMFDVIFVTTRGGPGNTTEVANLFVYDSAFRLLSFENSSTMSVLIVLAVLLFTLIFIKLSGSSFGR